MINFLWVTIGIAVIFFIFKGIFKATQKNIWNGISWVFGILLTICLVSIACLVSFPDRVVKQVVTIEAEDKAVDTSGVMYLSSGSGIHLSNEYYFSSNSTKEDVAEYLNKCVKEVNLAIKVGDDFVYAKNLGRIRGEEAENLVNQYKSWQETGVLPSDKARYKFLIFYFDLNF